MGKHPVLYQRLILIPFLIFPLVSSGAAQLQKEPGKDFQISVDVELVQLPISVVDRDGRPVLGLSQEHFQVFEDKVRQEISLFRHEDVPISVGLVIDNSGSMRNKRERVSSAALTFVRESNAEDETFIVALDDSAYLEQDFTRSIGNLMDALDNMDTRGETAFNDAVFLSLEHVKDDGRMDKKALLVITDGEDNKSDYEFREVMDKLKEVDVTIYAIGLLEQNDQRGGLFRKSPSQKARKALEEIAEATGGKAFFPESLSEVEDLCRQIAHDLRNHYTVGYNPSNKAFDGTYRTIDVEVHPPRGFPNLDVRTKPGYTAPTGKPVSENNP